MPRIRSVKPELASDRTLAQASRDARYTFILLISQADDDGLIRAEPRQLLGNLYPHDLDVTEPLLDQWLLELIQLGRLRWRITRDGMRVLEILNWTKHQQIKNRSKPFLQTQLEPLETELPFDSVGSTEDGGRVYGDPGGAEPRVLSPEPRVLPAEGEHSKGGNGKTPKKATWLSPFADLWTAGEPPFKQMAQVLKPLVDRDGSEVLVRWRRYLDRSPPYLWSVHRFKAIYNTLTSDYAGNGTQYHDEPPMEYVDG